MSCDFLALAQPGVQKLSPYVPGKPVDELARELDLDPAAHDVRALSEDAVPQALVRLREEDPFDGTRRILERDEAEMTAVGSPRAAGRGAPSETRDLTTGEPRKIGRGHGAETPRRPAEHRRRALRDEAQKRELELPLLRL